MAQVAKPKERKAEHSYLNAAGVVVDDIELATGCRYLDKSVGATHDWQSGLTAGTKAAMVWVFGAKTYMTNAASTERQAGGDGNAQVEMIRYKCGIIDQDRWPEIERDTVPTDLVMLAKAGRNAALSGKSVKAGQADQLEAGLLSKFQSDPEASRAAWAIPAVKVEFRKLQGKDVKTADDLLGIAGLAS